MTLNHLIPEVIDIAQASGRLILDIYQNGQFEQHIKSDNTPVTSADLAANQLVVERLSLLTPDIPVLSEEDANISLTERSQWSRYWLIDPLDGTQEFIAGSGDFATIIALIENNKPVMGVVYAPVSGVTYYAAQGQGAHKITADGETHVISTNKHQSPLRALTIAISRRQNVDITKARFDSQYQYDVVELGSASLKACLVAEGGADCYLRLGPTGEWDTAATQCIVEEAGGRIFNTHITPLSYNLRQTLENPNFIVLGDEQLPWTSILTADDRLMTAE
ncbi:3'(2'),5'-bisphosphate nucleotidase [Photobacterium aquimaris]|uniref:3'(2'),5'-bisphosphate nucleotidase CysQ n=1 Tax=Photobacterium aquimaris TaxID=512643 RepID=A0A2T3IH94_9GAMM|nr:3'(2'),5'-bisphosphate nucleotidase CysQ [Photobacterium aquimaris]OBU16024.1 3'(2'),5'-bisphosphate nucleotidase [Photobacterium aquimaris]OBU21114.1 3'(2'),5'-bisphosphate nucleotidase [Photobacterium aquimaris]PSU26979.1 3'(2'),5'-bisphosphate nucleotidase [Photobacterium aquimaris]PSV98459.1 3'(2'),5'-bisphosphate nucleotidase [Photobacterium aquimaris]